MHTLPRFLLVVFVLTALSSGVLSAQDAGRWQVAEVRELGMMAGPALQNAFLAPDGERFAFYNGEIICVYTVDGVVEEERCVDVDDAMQASPEIEAMQWSPDSRYLVLHENALMFFHEPDLWLIDTATGDIRNLTDDGAGDLRIFEPGWDNMDLAPTWLDATTLLFLRYADAEGDVLPPPDILTISVAGGEPERLGWLRSAGFAPVFAVDVSSDGTRLGYNYLFTDINARQNGLYVSDLDGERSRQLVSAAGRLVPFAVAFSPDDQYLLGISTRVIMDSSEATPHDSPARVTDVASGETFLIDEERYVIAAGWSPEGTTLAYLAYDRENPGNGGLFVTDTPGQPGRQLLPGNFIVPTSRQLRPMDWAANNTLLLARGEEFELIAVELTQAWSAS